MGGLVTRPMPVTLVWRDTQKKLDSGYLYCVHLAIVSISTWHCVGWCAMALAEVEVAAWLGLRVAHMAHAWPLSGRERAILEWVACLCWQRLHAGV